MAARHRFIAHGAVALGLLGASGCDILLPTGPRTAPWDVELVYPERPSLAVGDTVYFELLPDGSGATDWTWESDSPGTVWITDDGMAVAKSPGGAKVTARLRDKSRSTQVTVLAPTPFRAYDQFALGGFRGCARRAGSRELACWPGDLRLRDPPRHSEVVPGIPEFSSLEVGFRHTCGVKVDGTAQCWGENHGTFGNGDGIESTTPVPVAGSHRFLRLAAGKVHTCGITTDSTALCWGDDLSGQLGVGGGPVRFVPTPVVGGEKYLSIAVGEMAFTCAVRSDGAVRCWGWNGEGQLGDRSVEHSNVPRTVPSLPAAAEVEAGDMHACARTADGSVYCWGWNGQGSAGESLDIHRSAPHQVAGLPPVVELALGGSLSCARTASGEAWCWGIRHERELFTMEPIGDPTPRLVPGGHEFTRIAAGRNFACGLLADGDLRCWGDNHLGSIGDGTRITRVVPTRVR